MGRFVKVTEIGSDRATWVNLEHVRVLSEQKTMKGIPVITRIQIDAGWGEHALDVSQTPEEILSQA